MTHRTLDKLELEDMISYAEGAGNFRFDIKWSAINDKGKPISIFIDTKNYGSAGNMFKDLKQFKAYLGKIDNFDQLYIIQQGGRGITKEQMIERLRKVLNEDSKGKNEIFKTILSNENLSKYVRDKKITSPQAKELEEYIMNSEVYRKIFKENTDDAIDAWLLLKKQKISICE